MQGGWIYVLMTSSDYHRFKVGVTKNSPVLRVNQLKTGDPFIDLQVAYFIPALLGRLAKIETFLHARLGRRIRFHNDGLSEWFRGEPQDAWMLVESILKEMGCTVTDYFQPGEEKVTRFWYGDLISFFELPSESDDGLPL